jgi:hypothetical protein
MGLTPGASFGGLISRRVPGGVSRSRSHQEPQPEPEPEPESPGAGALARFVSQQPRPDPQNRTLE